MKRLPGLAPAIAASLCLAGPPAAAEPIHVDMAIVLALDVSLSMDRRELEIARESHAAAIASEPVLEAIANGAIGRIAVTYVEFAGGARQSIDWTIIEGRESAERFATGIRALRGGTSAYTSISSALLLASELFDTMPYRATAKVVDVVGDGIDGGITWLEAARAALLAKGVVINGMPLVIDPSQPTVAVFYATSVVGGRGAFSIPVNRIEQMPDAMRRKIVRELF